MKKGSQNYNVLEHLKKRSITDMQALKLYGIRRLAARIHDLKEKYGHLIKTDIQVTKKCRFAKYSLIK